jgi:uncharacterized membrane protein
MSNSSQTEVEAFLRRFRRGLAFLPTDIRDDLVDEVRSHIEERLAQGKVDLTKSFGSPEAYASRFAAEQALSAAASQGSPFQLVTVLLAKVRQAAFVVFLVLPLAVVEIMALALATIGVLKPFASDHVGLFLLDKFRRIGMDPEHGVHARSAGLRRHASFRLWRPVTFLD